jgi:beta-xylosidase
MGVHVWKSKDLKTWEPLGLVWDLDRAEGWQRFFHIFPESGEPRLVEPREMTAEMRARVPCRRGAWANEIHWAPARKTFVIAGSMNHNIGDFMEGGRKPIGHGFNGATFLLESTTGRPEGPYRDIQPDRPLTPRIDANFFTDDDGAMYLVFQDNRIARLKDDLSGLAEEPCRFQETDFPKEHYAEGAFLFKAHGKYHLAKTYWSDSTGSYLTRKDRYSYDPLIASSDSLRGPYGKRYNPLTGGGHGNFFADHQGNWWACVFNNPRNRCNKGGWTARAALVAMKWVDGRLEVDKERTDAFYAELPGPSKG